VEYGILEIFRNSTCTDAHENLHFNEEGGGLSEEEEEEDKCSLISLSL